MLSWERTCRTPNEHIFKHINKIDHEMWTHPGETALYSVARGKCDKYSGLEAGPVMCHGALIPRRLSNCPSLLILSDSVKNEFNSERTIRLSHIHAWIFHNL